MACTSPNQWLVPSPCPSPCPHAIHLPSRSQEQRQMDAASFEAMRQDHPGLDHVRQLIVDLVLDDKETGRPRSVPLGRDDHLHDAKSCSNNPELDDERSREHVLETTLAKVLLDLASEQANVRLAAKAGNVLLQELETARTEVDVLQEELDLAREEQTQTRHEIQRLKEQNAALETALHRGNGVYNSAWDVTPQYTLRYTPQRTSLTTSRPDLSCERCTQHEYQVSQLDQRIDDLRRRCLELEVAHERHKQREHELELETLRLQQHLEEEQLETQRTRHDLELVTLQLEEQVQQVDKVKAVRETLRCTLRRVEAEKDEFQARLTARDQLVEKLETWKARAMTQLQVAENRMTSAQAETKRVTQTLEQLQLQLEERENSQRSMETSVCEIDVEMDAKAAKDMEQLLQEATREIAALRQENRLLGRRIRSKRRQPVNQATTAADVLALDRQAAQTIDKNNSIEPLALEVETIVPVAQASEREVRDGNRPRRLSLKLNWVEKTATIVEGAQADEIESLQALEDKCTSSFVPLEGEQILKKETESKPPVVTTRKRPTELLRLCHHCTNHECCEPKEAINLPVVGVRENALVCALPMEQLKKREATDSPPTSPLYLGLSFIACATAAGLLVRR